LSTYTTTITTTSTIKENKGKKDEKENEELEFTPDNYNVIKIIKLQNNNLKWYLFKKIKNKEQKVKTITRRFRCFSHRKEENIIKEENDNNNDSFSDYCFKPQRNRKDFIDFTTPPLNESSEKQKKIEELERNNKELEEKLCKQEKDLNRLNLNYAKMINKSKNPENTEEKLGEKLEKLREENKKLIATVTKLKSEQQFIGMSFIADDLEGEQFIDDKCFEEILDNLIEKDKNPKDDKQKLEKTTINNQHPQLRHSNTRRFYKSKKQNE